ncbi:MAG: hypothetical protein HZB13_18510 [Acidobacteria bacterium]|nr:hypothetical protein [Acidobacteriota bacterium]
MWKLLALLALFRPPYEDRTHSSRVFAQDRHYRLFLPAAYDQGAQRYPVIYYFHGHSDRYTLERYDDGKDTVPKILDFVSRNPAIVVAVDGMIPEHYTGFYGGTPYDIYRDGGAYDFGEYFLELVSHIDSTLRTLPDRRHRATSGLSMGGYMSLYLSARYPHLISGVPRTTSSTTPAPWSASFAPAATTSASITKKPAPPTPAHRPSTSSSARTSTTATGPPPSARPSPFTSEPSPTPPSTPPPSSSTMPAHSPASLPGAGRSPPPAPRLGTFSSPASPSPGSASPPACGLPTAPPFRIAASPSPPLPSSALAPPTSSPTLPFLAASPAGNPSPPLPAAVCALPSTARAINSASPAPAPVRSRPSCCPSHPASASAFSPVSTRRFPSASTIPAPNPCAM